MPFADRLRDDLERLAEAPLTYDQVGTTAATTLPSGYHHDRVHAVIGHGTEDFAAAGDAVMSWRMHRRAGLTVTASSPRAELGATVVLGIGIGPLRLAAPCRVVYTVDEDRRCGFAYGTVRGHPESGEEAFVVELHDDGRVMFTITAFSRPARWYSRLGGPVARRTQRLVTNRYVRALSPP
jgi:uncharacterized protein (UPF0548 family)